MQKYPKTVVIKDDIQVLLRPMEAKDLDSLLDFFEKLPEQDRLFLKDDVTDRAIIAKWVDELNYDRILPVLAIHNDRIIGDATLHRDFFGWSKHVGEIRCVVSPDFQHMGLGSILVKELFSTAFAENLEKIVAMVMDGQKSAINAFQKIGLIQEAVLKNHVKDLSGKTHDLLILSNYTEELWKKMEDLIIDSEVRYMGRFDG